MSKPGVARSKSTIENIVPEATGSNEREVKDRVREPAQPSPPPSPPLQRAATARQRGSGDSNGGFVLPQWAVEAVLRPVIGNFSRVVWRMRLEGTEHIPPYTPSGRGLIIAANHQTYFDPFWISIPIKHRPLRYLAWNEAFDWRIAGRFMHLFGAVPLKLEGGDRAAMQRSLDWLRVGGGVMIFPEGGRGNPDGTLARFKPGAARLALEANVPVLPVTIRGAHTVWNREQKLPHAAHVTITYHPLQTIAPLPDEDTRTCARRVTDELQRVISSALEAK